MIELFGGCQANNSTDKSKINGKEVNLEIKVLQHCQFALQQLASGCDADDEPEDLDDVLVETSSAEFYDLLKSRVECPDFLKKLENAQASIPQNISEGGSSWDMIGENDLWEGGHTELDPEDYVLVGQEDIMEGIASFMASNLCCGSPT